MEPLLNVFLRTSPREASNASSLILITGGTRHPSRKKRTVSCCNVAAMAAKVCFFSLLPLVMFIEQVLILWGSAGAPLWLQPCTLSSWQLDHNLTRNPSSSVYSEITELPLTMISVMSFCDCQPSTAKLPQNHQGYHLRRIPTKWIRQKKVNTMNHYDGFIGK